LPGRPEIQLSYTLEIKPQVTDTYCNPLAQSYVATFQLHPPQTPGITDLGILDRLEILAGGGRGIPGGILPPKPGDPILDGLGEVARLLAQGAAGATKPPLATSVLSTTPSGPLAGSQVPASSAAILSGAKPTTVAAQTGLSQSPLTSQARDQVFVDRTDADRLLAHGKPPAGGAS
jgi:hypothetical protein